jgi:hypothetical protein
MILEYKKCSKDPIYFIENYMKIINIDEGLVSFKLRGYQKKIVRSLHDNRFTVLATSRQVGKTTSTCGFLLWYIIFNEYKTVGILANKESTALEILGRIELAYQHLPIWLQMGVKEWNKKSFELENGSRILAAPTSSTAVRGWSLNMVFVDECAHIEGWDDFWKSVFPTITSGKETKVALVSTPCGMNHFYKIVSDAEAGRNSYSLIKVMWNDVPGRDAKWKKAQLENMSQEDFEQEHCIEFLGSSGSLIAGWKLKELVHQEPLTERLGLSMYFEPVKDHIYIIVVDVSRGKGLDYSAFQVIDVSQMPYEQVAVFRSNVVPPVEYGEIIHRVGALYNSASVLVEINDIGGEVADMLHFDMEYDNLLFTESAGRAGKRLASNLAKNKADRGIRTTPVVKSVGCSLLKLLVEQNQLIINDFDTIQEMTTFSRKGKSYEAEPGNHDDLVMGLVLFAWLTQQLYFRELSSIDTLMRLREKSGDELTSELMPFGTIMDGVPEDEIVDIGAASIDNWLWNE